MQQVPSYLLPRPSMYLSAETVDAFEDLFASIVKDLSGKPIDYRLSAPKWQFLSYIGETKAVVLHGSYNPGILMVEPRQAQDIRAFSAQRAVYATTDGIWAIFFAVLDRQRYPMGLFNACFQASLPTGEQSEPFYFFSITATALARQPWCEGAVYILPRDHFEQEPPQQQQGIEIVVPHWIGTVVTRPMARLIVGPGDFPFLDEIRGHDDQELVARATSDPDGFPWLDEGS